MKKFSSRDRLRLLAGAGALSAVQSAGMLGMPRTASAAAPRTLTWSVTPEPPSLNAAFSSASVVQQISSKMMEGLLSYDSKLAPQAALATAWQISPDGSAITFKLRQGVRWHDGKPFTSADVKFTFEEVLKKYHSRGRATFVNLASVETPDEATAVFKLTGPSPYIMASLAACESPILPKHLYAVADPTKVRYINAPVGTGPFKFKSWERGSYVQLERNADYWDMGKPYIDQLILRFIPDAGARAVAFETGEVDIGGGFPVTFTEIVRLSKLPHLALTTEGYAMLGGMSYLELNMRDPQFKDLRVRQAIAHALDKDFIIKNIWYGFATAATGPISPRLATAYSSDVPAYAFDLKKAEALLDQAGFPRGSDGMRFKITHEPSPYDDRFKRFGEYFKQALLKIGIGVDLKTVDAAAYLRNIWNENAYQTTFYGIFNTTDPSIGVQRLYWSRNIKKGVPYSNGSGYSSPEMDRILEAAQVENDPGKRGELFAQMQRLAMTDLPIIPIVNENFVTLYNKRVRNIENDPEGTYGTFSNIMLAS